MIKKTYLMILSVTIVSVLLGLFIINMASALKPSPLLLTDSVKISLVSSAYFLENQGIGVVATGQFPFVFSPRQTLMNVTDLSIFIVYSGRGIDFSMNLLLNDLQVESLGFEYSSTPYPYHIHVEDINIYNALHSGINTLSFEGVGFFRLQEISMFIEYTY